MLRAAGRGEDEQLALLGRHAAVGTADALLQGGPEGHERPGLELEVPVVVDGHGRDLAVGEDLADRGRHLDGEGLLPAAEALGRAARRLRVCWCAPPHRIVERAQLCMCLNTYIYTESVFI